MTVRELIAILLDHPMDGMIGVCDRTSWDRAEDIMMDPNTHPEVALALAVARMGGFSEEISNDLAEVKRIEDGDFRTMLVITGRPRER